jgi:hypothetical protein
MMEPSSEIPELKRTLIEAMIRLIELDPVNAWLVIRDAERIAAVGAPKRVLPASTS